MLRRELFCRKPQLVGAGFCYAWGKGTPLASAQGCFLPPSPPSLPQRAFIWRMRRCGNAVAFPVAAVPRYDFTPARRILPCRRYFPYPSGLSCRAPGRVTHSALVAGVAMARARRRSRTPARADGAPQQARTSPGRNGREGSRRRPTRHAADEVQPDSRDYFRVTAKRGVRGCRGCRGAAAPLTPCPAPGRRPAAHAGQQPQFTTQYRPFPGNMKKREACLTACDVRHASHFLQ